MGEVLGIGESVLIDYGKQEGIPIYTDTGKPITDPQELEGYYKEFTEVRRKAKERIQREGFA